MRLSLTVHRNDRLHSSAGFLFARFHLNANTYYLYAGTDRVNCRSIFYDALAVMATDWKEAAISDVRIMVNKANLSRHFSNVIIGLHSIGALSYGIGVLVTHTDDIDDAMGSPHREFVLKMQLPFDCNESPLYEIVMSLEFLHQLASSAVTGILNSLIITLVSGTCNKFFKYY